MLYTFREVLRLHCTHPAPENAHSPPVDVKEEIFLAYAKGRQKIMAKVRVEKEPCSNKCTRNLS